MRELTQIEEFINRLQIKRPEPWFTIDLMDKFYPEADKWMWDYCTYLGKYTDSQGRNYDLGVFIDFRSIYNGKVEVCEATVHSNKDGDYYSCDFDKIKENRETRERVIECYKRAKFMNLIS